jgi:hypothetical protein
MRDYSRVVRTGEDIDLAAVTFQIEDPSARFVGSEVLKCSSLQEMEAFIAARDSLPSRLHGFVVPYSLEDYLSKRAHLFLTADERGGFAVINGELASLFSLPGARYGDVLVAASVQSGAERLSCYDNHGKLFTLYSRHGFRETLRVSWNDEFAPHDWDYDAWGRPDYVEMRQ